MTTLTKRDLVKEVAVRAGISQRECGNVIDALLDVTTETLCEGGTVKLVGFGALRCRHRPACKSKHPATGVPIDVPPRTVPYFKAGDVLMRKVNGEQ